MSVASLAGIAALYLLAVRTDPGQRFDELAVLQNRYVRTSDADADRYLEIVAGLLAVVGLVACWLGRRSPRVLAAAIVGVSSTYVVATVLRDKVLGRIDLVGHDSMNGPSFPSGHAAVAMVIALTLVVVCSPRSRSVVTAALTVASSVGVLVIMIPIHRPSDVVAGQLLGLSMMCLSLAAIPRAVDQLRDTRGANDPSLRPRELIPVALACGCLTVAWLALTTLLAHRGGFGLGDFGRWYPLAVLVVVLGSAAMIVLFRLAVGSSDIREHALSEASSSV